MSGIEFDLSGKTLAELRALVERLRLEAHTEIFSTITGPVVQLALTVMELAKRGDASAIAQQAGTLWDVASFKWHISAPRPVPVYTAPDLAKPALRMQKPRLDTEFDVHGIRGDGWLLVYRNVVDGVVKLEYWIRLADLLAG